jgi:hypothetical protein
MTAASSLSYDALLLELWPQDDIYDLLYDSEETFYGIVKKDPSFYEKLRHLAVGFGTTQGASASFSDAKAGKSASRQSEWKVTNVTYYSLFSIQRKLLKQARNRKAAILPALERESKMAIEVWRRMTSIYCWGNGVGSLGQISQIGGTFNGIVLTNAQIGLVSTPDVKHFELDMAFDASVDNTGAAGVRTRLSRLVVTNVDGENGIVTFNQNVTDAIPTAAANDYLYRQGDYNAVIAGVPAWIPTSVPTSTPFFGMDRSKYPQRLGGWRVPCAKLSPRGAAMKAAKVLRENGGKPSHYFLSPNDFFNLQMELQSAGNFQMVKEPGKRMDGHEFGEPFEGISFQGPGGTIKAFSDINVPDNYGWMLDMRPIAFATLGETPAFVTDDGSRILREGDADAYEGRIAGDMQLTNEAPGKSAVALLAA